MSRLEGEAEVGAGDFLSLGSQFHEVFAATRSCRLLRSEAPINGFGGQDGEGFDCLCASKLFAYLFASSTSFFQDVSPPTHTFDAFHIRKLNSMARGGSLFPLLILALDFVFLLHFARES
jgi:hypothetical protein